MRPKRGEIGENHAQYLHDTVEKQRHGDGVSSNGKSEAVLPVRKKGVFRRRKKKRVFSSEKTQANLNENKHEAPHNKRSFDTHKDKRTAVKKTGDQSQYTHDTLKVAHNKQKKSKISETDCPQAKSFHNSKNNNKARSDRALSAYAHSTKDPLYAALDLGTNNCRLLIATPTKPGYFRVVDAFSKIVRLGEGLSHSGSLNDKAMDRAVEALKICRSKLEQCHIKRHRLVATEACRVAKNGDKFIQRVLNETGLNLEIVNRETEARLAVSGCGTLVDQGTDAIVLFDIGGGSSEIALIDMSHKRSPRLADHITAWTSLPVGVVTLAEQFGGCHVSLNDYERMKAYVRDLLQDFQERHKLGALVKSPHFHLLGTSGTITTLAGMYLDLEKYDRRRIDGIWMQSDAVTQMTEQLLSWNLEERIANPCIGQDRADLVLAGCAILDAIREIWPSERLRVADRGLREGILTELMSRDGAWRKRHRTNGRYAKKYYEMRYQNRRKNESNHE
ncbi:Ppx/GppA phosphatase family protein [Bartonella tamiae]|uniref:Ppx/GppA phosphatase N-terminal domain-containing protein n=1 Tax=Bartonella tamiae Th239 TaxID=1094558 RepID=J0ZPA2_9HYPH|nr:Ppx/GppA phosphatase family protein [Bartonella tamiae]EJF90393.1 hypothetical protein ME5_00794 [Bartonella tamiae Th239]EJF93663.1 hypothetical protein MEG_01087 [Bartonella tamiae Th307]